MDQGDNIEPVLYDALSRRFDYCGEIDIWTVGKTTWTRLEKEVSWEISPRYTTACIKTAEGVALMPALGWEIRELERQHVGSTQDIGTDVEVRFCPHVSMEHAHTVDSGTRWVRYLISKAQCSRGGETGSAGLSVPRR